MNKTLPPKEKDSMGNLEHRIKVRGLMNKDFAKLHGVELFD